MHIPHPLGVAGLLLNTVGAFALLRYATPNPYAGMTITRDQFDSLFHGGPEQRRMQRAVLYYRGAIFAMALGFILQLVDLLTT